MTTHEKVFKEMQEQDLCVYMTQDIREIYRQHRKKRHGMMVDDYYTRIDVHPIVINPLIDKGKIKRIAHGHYVING